MNKFSWGKAIGFGLIIWAVMAIALLVLANVKSLDPLWAHGIVSIIGAISAFLLALNLKAGSATQSVAYGIAWIVTVVFMDLIVTQWMDAHIFFAWQYWIGPALVAMAPWIEIEAKHGLTHHPV